MARWAPDETVRRARDGEPGAADRLVEAVWPGCFRLAATVVGDVHLAQDAAQETCALILRKIGSLRDLAAFDTWLYRIVLREASRTRRPRSSEYAEGPPFLAEDRSTAIDVWRALQLLPPNQRDVVVLFYFDDLTSERIAQILRIPHATVRSRLARARERLRLVLADYRFEPTSLREVQQHA